MDITSLEQQAIDFAKRGDFGADARRVNDELTKLAPTNQGAWTRLARCNIELGLLDEANTALETVLQLNPQNTIARSLLQESIRRSVRLETPDEPVRRTRKAASPRTRTGKGATPRAAARHGFGRAQFAALGQLAPKSAVESLAPTIDSLLTPLNERAFATKIVEARNRAGHPGNVLFRRNTIHAGGDGHLYATHHGGRWEPQISVNFFAAPQWGRSAIAAGITFDFTGAAAPASDGERLREYFEQFQKLVAGQWKQLLTGWMAANAGFVQEGSKPPSTDVLPPDAVAWLASDRASTLDRVFVGRWLFADRPADAAIMEDPGQLTGWLEQTFVELLPLWMSIYRDA